MSHETTDWLGANVLVKGIEPVTDPVTDSESEFADDAEPDIFKAVPNRADRRKKNKRH